MAKGVTVDLIVDPKRALDGMEKASGGANKFTDVLRGLGRIGAGAVAAVGAAAVTAAAGLTAATVSAGKYADEILTTATNTNISTEALQAYKYAAELIDVPFETFVASQGKFVKAQQAAADGTLIQSEAFARLGLSATDASGNLVDSTTLYWDAIDALGQVANETERTSLAQELFGRSGAELNSIIKQGSAGFAELTEQARAAGAILSGEQLAALGAFDDKMQSLTSTIDAAKNALGLTLLPVLDQLAGEGGSALGKFTSALLDADGNLAQVGPAFEDLANTIGQSLATAVPKVLQIGTSVVSGLITGIVSEAPKLIKTAIPLIISFATAILGMLPSVLDAGFKVLVSLANGIAEALPELIPAAVDALVSLVGVIIDNLPLLLDAGLQIVTGLAEGLIKALPTLLDALPGLIIGLVNFFVGAIPTIIQTGVTLLLALVDALPTVIDALVGALPDIIVAIVVAIVSAIPQLTLAGIQLFIGLIGALPEIIVSLVGAIPQIIEGLVTAFTAPATIAKFGDVGKQLVEGLGEGIGKSFDGLIRKVTGWVGGLVSGIKNVLGIRSPSTVFAGIGTNMIRGLEVGLSGRNNVGSILSGLAGQVASGFNADLSVRARAVATGADGGDAAVVSQARSTPSFNMPIYMLPEQDPRIVGRQIGREFARELAGVPA